MRLDNYDILPEGMDVYLRNYGWHFSKKMCEWAVSKMRDRSGRKLTFHPKEEIENIMQRHNVPLNNDNGYDKVFVYHMGLSDYLGSSIVDEMHLAHYVKDVLDDVDGYDGIAFTRFYADCSGKGIPINWEDMM